MGICLTSAVRLTIAVLLALAFHPTIGAQAPREARDPLQTGAPASVGFNRERPARLDAGMKRFGDEGQHTGIVMLLARRVTSSTGGRGFTAHQRCGDDPAEEGRIVLDDPLAKYLPALNAVSVCQGWNRSRSGSGAATTAVIIDPRKQLIGLVLAQHMLSNEHDLFRSFNTLVYQAPGRQAAAISQLRMPSLTPSQSPTSASQSVSLDREHVFRFASVCVNRFQTNSSRVPTGRRAFP